MLKIYYFVLRQLKENDRKFSIGGILKDENFSY